MTILLAEQHIDYDNVFFIDCSNS